MGSTLFEIDVPTDLEAGRDLLQRHGGTKLKGVCLVSLCLRASVVETGFMARSAGRRSIPR